MCSVQNERFFSLEFANVKKMAKIEVQQQQQQKQNSTSFRALVNSDRWWGIDLPSDIHPYIHTPPVNRCTDIFACHRNFRCNTTLGSWYCFFLYFTHKNRNKKFFIISSGKYMNEWINQYPKKKYICIRIQIGIFWTDWIIDPLSDIPFANNWLKKFTY